MSTAEYKKATYDRIGLVVRKGKRKEYQQAADDFGLSLSELIKIAIEKFIAEQSYESFTSQTIKTPFTPKSEQKLTEEQKRLVEEFSNLPVDTQKAFMKVFTSINNASKGGD
ncbi:MAG: hypothetical protein IKT98_07305 [Selenomonadaceae bacterium]|nr:hypothetical protein [Selenomonadaceae bacterium]